MRVLILGGAGMLGHRAWLAFRDHLDTFVTLRKPFAFYERLALFNRDRTIDQVDAREEASLARAIEIAKPDVVVNCIGIVKQLPEGNDPEISLQINSLLPHRIVRLCKPGRLIHISTDCVFTGSRGNYSETDIPDATDLYGRTKFLGEVGSPHLTLRTSLIGRELSSAHGLVEWFLSNKGKTISGFTRVYFSGVPTYFCANVLREVTQNHKGLQGVYHLAAAPINKHELLQLAQEFFDIKITIQPDPGPQLDRTLNGAAFAKATGITVPDWRTLVQHMAADRADYETWRRSDG